MKSRSANSLPLTVSPQPVYFGHAGGATYVVGYDNPTTTSYGNVFAATMAC